MTIFIAVSDFNHTDLKTVNLNSSSMYTSSREETPPGSSPSKFVTSQTIFYCFCCQLTPCWWRQVKPSVKTSEVWTNGATETLQQSSERLDVQTVSTFCNFKCVDDLLITKSMKSFSNLKTHLMVRPRRKEETLGQTKKRDLNTNSNQCGKWFKISQAAKSRTGPLCVKPRYQMS